MFKFKSKQTKKRKTKRKFSHTLAPLLGPIGAGLGLGSSAGASAVAAAAGGGGAASSAAARITNLDDLEREWEFLGKKAREDNLEEDEMVVEEGMTTPEAMHERLEAAMGYVSETLSSGSSEETLGVNALEEGV